jgi:proline iminopeptidase
MNEGHLAVRGAQLYYREVGDGEPLIVVHGGPDFDHFHLLPEMDRLADRFRLIYYDQRGRGRSSGQVKPEDVSIETEVSDLDWLRQHFELDTVGVLGHSWGALLALEYTAAHPDRVNRLILMNAAPATHEDFLHFRLQRESAHADRLAVMRQIAATPAYQEGDIEAEARYYRLHFDTGMAGEENVEKIVTRLRRHFTPADIVKARAIEDRLHEQTWQKTDYDVLARLGEFAAPTLVIHGAQELIPVECARRIATAIPGAKLVVLENCGHFAYLEQPQAVRTAVEEWTESSRGA